MLRRRSLSIRSTEDMTSAGQPTGSARASPRDDRLRPSHLHRPLGTACGAGTRDGSWSRVCRSCRQALQVQAGRAVSGMSFWSHDGFHNAFSGRGRGVEPLRGHLIRQGTPLRAVHHSGAAWRARSVPCVQCPAARTEAHQQEGKSIWTCGPPAARPRLRHPKRRREYRDIQPFTSSCRQLWSYPPPSSGLGGLHCPPALPLAPRP